MAIEEDNVLKQIKGVSKVVAKVLFNKDTFDYVLPADGNYSVFDNLFIKLKTMIKNNQINEAENLLFEKVNVVSPISLQIALNFYVMLAEKSDKELKEYNFSKAEVEQGFFDVLALFNIKVEKNK